MRRLYSLLLCFIPILAHAQVTIGEPIPAAEQVEGAKKTLEATKPLALAIDVDAFQVILPSKAIQGIPLRWAISNSACIEFDFVAPGETHSFRGRMMGDTVSKLHKFKAQPFGWAIAHGKDQGVSNLDLWKNGADPKVDPPAIATTAVITVGPKPDDDDPNPPGVESELTKSVRAAVAADRAAGKFDQRWLKELAGMYDRASKMDMSKVTSTSQLDTVLNNARLASGMPEYTVCNTAVRTMAQKEMYTALGIPLGTDATIAVDAMRLLKLKLADLAKSLTIVVP